MSKAKKIAAALNTHYKKRPYDYKGIVESAAATLNAGIYWIGTASNYKGLPQCEVWQQNKRGEWVRKLGEVCLGHDGIWRAS